MNKNFFKDFKVFKIEPGNIVLCDLCNEDWTNSEVSGGFLFQSKAVCPDCSKEFLGSIKQHNEEQFIRGRCPEDSSFANWIRSMRVF